MDGKTSSPQFQMRLARLEMLGQVLDENAQQWKEMWGSSFLATACKAYDLLSSHFPDLSLVCSGLHKSLSPVKGFQRCQIALMIAVIIVI